MSYDNDNDSGELILGLIMLPMALLIDGLVVMHLWNWFIPVMFTTVKAISFVKAIGFSLVVGYLTYKPDMLREENRAKIAVATIVLPFCWLLIGWVIHLFM
jgi:hypothetical protein